VAGGRKEQKKWDAGAAEMRSCIPCCAPRTLLSVEARITSVRACNLLLPNSSMANLE